MNSDVHEVRRQALRPLQKGDGGDHCERDRLALGSCRMRLLPTQKLGGFAA